MFRTNTSALNLAAQTQRLGTRRYAGQLVNRVTGAVEYTCDTYHDPHLHTSERVASVCAVARLRALLTTQAPVEFTTLVVRGGQTFYEACASLAA